MKFGHQMRCSSLVVTLLAARTVSADAPAPVPPAATGEPATAETTTDDNKPTMPKPAASSSDSQWGVMFTLRGNWLPTGILELFLEQSPTYVFKPGLALSAYRVKGSSELAFTVGWESFNGPSGLAIAKNEPIPQFEADYVEFDGFGWLSLEAALHGHTPLAGKLDLRYGGTFGLTLTLGDILHTDYACTTNDPDSCSQRAGGAVRQPYDIPPVLGVVGADIGLRYRATPKLDVSGGVGLRLLILSANLNVGYRF